VSKATGEIASVWAPAVADIASALAVGVLVGVLVIVVALCCILLSRRGGSVRRRDNARLLAVDPSVAPAVLRGYALALLDVHRLGEAEEVASLYLGHEPSDAHVRALLASLLAVRGEHAPAVEALELAAAALLHTDGPTPPYLAPFAALLHVALAKELRMIGRLSEAEAAMAQVIQFDAGAPGCAPDCMRLLGEAVRASELERAAFEQLSAWDAAGRAPPRALGFGDVNAAARFYRQALAAHPDDARLLGDLAQALHATGDHQNAEQCFRDALARRPDDPWLRYDYGMLLWRADRLGEAAAELRTARRAAPQSAAIEGVYALLLLRQGKTADAGRHLLVAVTHRPDVWILPRVYGRVMLAEGRASDAAKAYRQAERLGAEDLGFRLEYADVLAQLERTEQAEAQYQFAIRSDEHSGTARARYAAFLLSRCHLQEAEQQARRALLCPDGEDAHTTLAGVLLLERRLEEAFPHVQAALEYDGISPRAREHHASYLLLRGEAAEAHVLAQRLIDQGVGSGSLQLVLAGSLLTLNRQLEAEAALRQALRVEPLLPDHLLRQAAALRQLGYGTAAAEAITQAVAVAPGWPEALAAREDLAREQSGASISVAAPPTQPHG
jgi:tetratricopeptide (TPR) repeat protein